MFNRWIFVYALCACAVSSIGEGIVRAAPSLSLEEYLLAEEAPLAFEANKSEESSTEACLDHLWKRVKEYDYHWGGNGNGEFDCSGFVRAAASICLNFKFAERSTGPMWREANRRCNSVKLRQTEAGDICFEPGHVEMVVRAPGTDGIPEVIEAANHRVDMRRAPMQNWERKQLRGCWRCGG